MLQNRRPGVKRKPPPDVGGDPSRGAATEFSPGLKSWVKYGKQGTKSRRDGRKAALIRLPHQAKPGFATGVEGVVEIETQWTARKRERIELLATFPKALPHKPPEGWGNRL
jgi:hypothetical protein